MCAQRMKWKETGKEDVPILKPDHVSLGKCTACHQFIHRYSSVNDTDIVDLLRAGCKYDGFKNDIHAESEEEESFTNMHHVLLLSSLDDMVTKELCVQRINDCSVIAAELVTENVVVSDNSSVVVFIYNGEEYKVDVYYFGKQNHSYAQINDANDFSVMLDGHVVFLKFPSFTTVINFNGEVPSVKNVTSDSDTCILATSKIMVVTSRQRDAHPLLYCEHLDLQLCRELPVSKETWNTLFSNQNAIFTVFQNIIWLSANNERIFVYSYSINKDLCLLDTIDLNNLGDIQGLLFMSFSFSACSNQVFLLYHQYSDADKNSFVIVFDLKTLNIVGVLEMELTMNRQPQLQIYPSSDGAKLFVQERFENRVIFYQTFSLLPTNFSLQNIVKRFIWKRFSRDFIVNSKLPKNLLEEVLGGY